MADIELSCSICTRKVVVSEFTDPERLKCAGCGSPLQLPDRLPGTSGKEKLTLRAESATENQPDETKGHAHGTGKRHADDGQVPRPPTAESPVLPDHLRMRIAVTDAKGNVVRTARDPGILQHVSTGSAIDDFREAQRRWEKSPIERWEDVGGLPDEVALKGPGGRR